MTSSCARAPSTVRHQPSRLRIALQIPGASARARRTLHQRNKNISKTLGRSSSMSCAKNSQTTCTTQLTDLRKELGELRIMDYLRLRQLPGRRRELRSLDTEILVRIRSWNSPARITTVKPVFFGGQENMLVMVNWITFSASRSRMAGTDRADRPPPRSPPGVARWSAFSARPLDASGVRPHRRQRAAHGLDAGMSPSPSVRIVESTLHQPYAAPRIRPMTSASCGAMATTGTWTT